jgi:hypothetical protein
MLPINATVLVERSSSTVSGASESFSGYETVDAALECLIEGMGAWRQNTILGDLGGYKFHMTWTKDLDLLEQDLITYQGRKYNFKRSVDDTHRMVGSTRMPSYRTGFLEEEVLGGRF